MTRDGLSSLTKHATNRKGNRQELFLCVSAGKIIIAVEISLPGALPMTAYTRLPAVSYPSSLLGRETLTVISANRLHQEDVGVGP